MENNLVYTPHNYCIDVSKSITRDLIDNANVLVHKFEEYIATDRYYRNNSDFQLTLFKFAFSIIPNLEEFLVINQSNDKLTINQRGLIVDLVRISKGEIPQLSVPLRLGIIVGDRETNAAPCITQMVTSDRSVSAIIGWATVFRTLNIHDIVCVTKEIFANRD
jgi:hypothetical protein